MEVRELESGFWQWSLPHPRWEPGKDWPELVGSVYLEAADALLLVDPLVPDTPEEAERFWHYLDRDVRRCATPVAIVLCNRCHARSSRTIYQRYAGSAGCRIWAPQGAERGLAFPPTDLFAPGDALPGGLQAHFVDGLAGPEAALHVPQRSALIVGNALLGDAAGGLQLAPASFAAADEAGQAAYRERYPESLAALLDLEFDRLLASHGPPLAEGGSRALERALWPELR